jgi:hypothetical protein
MTKAGLYKSLVLLICSSFLALHLQAQGSRRAETGQNDSQDSSRQGRLRPPGTLSCDANQTTSFTGRVLSYARTSRSIFIRVRTDEATTEQFTIKLAGTADALKKFLIKGEEFRPADFRKIELRRNRLKPGMRATVWACYVNNEPKAELIDWRPGERPTGSVY